MAQIVKIHASKQPRRPHFIKEWAAKRRLSQADLARELDADKSIVSRWFAGATPGVEWQAKLAALFSVEPDSLFRHPDDDWLHALFLKRKALKEVSPGEPGLDDRHLLRCQLGDGSHSGILLGADEKICPGVPNRLSLAYHHESASGSGATAVGCA